MTRDHECIEYIDVRFHGAEPEGDTYCVVCGSSYTEAELSAMSEDAQREPELLREAA